MANSANPDQLASSDAGSAGLVNASEGFGLSSATTQSHQGFCCPLIHSAVSIDSLSSQ